MHYRVDHAREIEGLYVSFCEEDPLVCRDADQLDRDLRSHPHRAGVQLESGLWAARRGRLAVLYDILEADLLVRILVAKLCSNRHSIARSASYLDQLEMLFKAVTRGTVLPEAEELEALIHRDPRTAGVRLPDGSFEAKLGRVTLVYEVSENPPAVTVTGVRFDE